MKKITLFTLTLGLAVSALAQNKVAKSNIEDGKMMRNNYDDFVAKTINPLPINNTNAVSKTAATYSVMSIGSSSNPNTSSSPTVNGVFVNNQLGLVGWIHRQNFNNWGGTSTSAETGVFRVDVSLDRGDSWEVDLGPAAGVNPTGTSSCARGRYPMATSFNPNGSTDPCDVKIVYYGAGNNYPSGGWKNHVWGVASNSTKQDGSCANSPTSTAHYIYCGTAANNKTKTVIPSSLTQGKDGEFWAVDNKFDSDLNGANGKTLDSLWVFKGVWNSTTNDVDWAKFAMLGFNPFLQPGNTADPDGNYSVGDPVLAFAPNKMDGYIAVSGKPANATAFQTPGGYAWKEYMYIWRTADGGVTWNALNPIDLTALKTSWNENITDVLKTYLTDSTGTTITDSTAGIPYLGSYEIVVDINGNPHIGAAVFNAAELTSNSADSSGYYTPGAVKYMSEIYSSDFGQTWTFLPINRFNTHQGTILSFTFGNYPQIARNETGTIVGFSWVDDSSATASDAMAPNLWTAAREVAIHDTVIWETVEDVTTSDGTWKGKIVNPSMGPVLLDKQCASGKPFNFPIVFADITRDQSTSSTDPSTEFYYINCLPVTLKNDKTTSLNVNCDVYPNPNNGNFSVEVKLAKADNISLEVFDVMGRKVYSQSVNNTTEFKSEINLTSAAGLYIVKVTSSQGTVEKKVVKQ